MISASQHSGASARASGSAMRIALWIASPPTCSVRTPRASLTAMAGPWLVRKMPYLLLWRLDKLQYGALHGQVRPEKAAAGLSQALCIDQGVRDGLARDEQHVVRHLLGNERLQNCRPRPAVGRRGRQGLRQPPFLRFGVVRAGRKGQRLAQEAHVETSQSEAPLAVMGQSASTTPCLTQTYQS